MNRYKAIITDLDGTLVRWNAQLSSLTKEVLKRCIEQGIHIIIATARPPRYVLGYLEGLPKECWVICYNGAEIWHEGKRVSKQYINKACVSTFIDTVLDAKDDMALAIEADDQIFSDQDLGRMFGESFPYTKVNRQHMRSMEAAKILISHEDIGILNGMIEKLPSNCRAVLTDGGRLVQVIDKGVDKSCAAAWVMNELGLSLDVAVAFGDDYNDIDLLDSAGLGVAVENAPNEVLVVADRHCASPEKDGVAKMIEKLFFDT